MLQAHKYPALVLASASPRRSELLRNAGIPFRVQAANISEDLRAGESPLDHAKRLACEKARAVLQQVPSEIVLGADTIVVADSYVLGKPHDAADATRMLRLLSGRSHQVITGICLVTSRPHAANSKKKSIETRNSKLETVLEDVRAETTQVFMKKLNEQEIRDYIANGEPMDKAGAYAIQGLASRWITRIVGCYFNVVGLPVPLVYRMLQERNYLK